MLSRGYQTVANLNCSRCTVASGVGCVFSAHAAGQALRLSCVADVNCSHLLLYSQAGHPGLVESV
jgi:hypothetical protein